MNDKDRDLLMQILQTAGETGQRGFAYLVHYHFVDGVVGIFGWSAVFVGAAFLLKRLFAWKTHDEAGLGKAVGIVVVCLFMFGSLCGVGDSIRDALAPEGAAVVSALTALHHS